MSLHQVDFVHMLQMAERLGYRIGPAGIYGVEPRNWLEHGAQPGGYGKDAEAPGTRNR